MNIYDFTGLNETVTNSFVPTEAIVFNGVKLDEKLPYYRTLNVSGRENFERSLNTVETSGDGEFLLSSKLNAKTIVVTFALEADNAQDFNNRFDELKRNLFGTDVPFSFADETQYTRYGTVTKLDNPQPGQLSIVGTFEISQSNPYKYAQLVTVTGANTVQLNGGTNSNIELNKITFSLVADALNVKLNVGTGYTLSLSGNFKANNDFTIDFDNKTITSINTSVLGNMNIPESNIFEAVVLSGDKVTGTNIKNLSVSYREKTI